MASPAFANFGSTSTGSGLNSRSPGLPTGRSNGDLLIGYSVVRNSDSHTWTGTGWTKIDEVTQGAFTISLAYCVVNGSESAPTVSWTTAASAYLRIARWTGTANESPFSGSHGHNAGNGATHSKTGVTTTRADSRVIYLDFAAINTHLDTPSGWTENNDTSNALAATNVAIGGKDIASSGSASGDISVTGGNADWVMWQIELRSPSAGGVVSPMIYHVLLGACG